MRRPSGFYVEARPTPQSSFGLLAFDAGVMIETQGAVPLLHETDGSSPGHGHQFRRFAARQVWHCPRHTQRRNHARRTDQILIASWSFSGFDALPSNASRPKDDCGVGRASTYKSLGRSHGVKDATVVSHIVFWPLIACRGSDLRSTPSSFGLLLRVAVATCVQQVFPDTFACTGRARICRRSRRPSRRFSNRRRRTPRTQACSPARGKCDRSS